MYSLFFVFVILWNIIIAYLFDFKLFSFSTRLLLFEFDNLLDLEVGFGAEFLEAVLSFVEDGKIDLQSTHYRKLHAFLDQIL